MPTIPLKLQDNLIASIARRIITGELPEGKVLTEDELTHEYNLSRTVVREAIKRLTTLGMVSSRPKVGTIIRPRADWQLLHPDVLEWMIKVEPGLALQLGELRQLAAPGMSRIAAKNATAEDRVALQAAHDRLVNAIQNDHDDLSAADRGFFDCIVAAGHNELLLSLVRQLMDAMRAARTSNTSYQGLDLGDKNAVQALMKKYTEILHAILEGDSDVAARVTFEVFGEAQARMKAQAHKKSD